MREIWKPIPIKKYLNCYEVSNRGRIRRGTPASRIRKYKHLIKSRVDSRYGYALVDLWSQHKAKRFFVHKLVLLAFKGPALKNQETLHKNHCRSDNRLENLRWGTRSQNMRDMLKHHINGRRKLSVVDVRKIRVLLKQGVSCQTISKNFNLEHSTPYKIKNCKIWGWLK